MRRLLLLGLVLLSCSWLFILPIFTSPNYLIGFLFITIGVICFITGLGDYKIDYFNKKYIILLVPLILCIILIPFPLTLGPILILISVLHLLSRSYLKCGRFNNVSIGLFFSGIILTFQMLFFPVYSIVATHFHRVDFLSGFTSVVGRLFGLETSVNNGVIFVQTFQEIYPFTTTLEKLGFFPWFSIFIGFLVLLFFFPRVKKIGLYLLGFLVLSVIFVLLRYVSLVFIFTNTGDLSVFWNPFIITLSFILFALLLMKFMSFKDFSFSFDFLKNLRFKRSRFVMFLLVSLSVFLLVGGFVFQDPGSEKNGRVLIDEKHSLWEVSTRPMDKEWYGQNSTYNYYSWAEWLDYYYQVERNTNISLTSDLLNNYDILVLKCPTSSYSDEEVDDIVCFVENGGGLYLIGDHTNILGMNSYLNKVASRFGIVFNTDATFKLGTREESTFVPEALFPHIAVKNVESFNFLTSCSLQAPVNSENVIVGNSIFAEPGTYSTEMFFREAENLPDIDYGLILQSAAVKHGNGRVLAFTDSTCFSGFCMFMDGYEDFNLGVFEYLNRSNMFNYLNLVFIVLSFILLGISLYLLRKKEKTMILTVFIFIGMFSFAIGAPVFSYVNNASYQTPEGHTDYIKVCFDQEHSFFKTSPNPFVSLENMEDDYNVFFVWTQRVGCFPSLEKTLESSVSNGNAVVMINPNVDFDDKEINLVSSYVRAGGKLLLMDTVDNVDSTSNQLLQSFNIWLSKNSTSDILEINGYGLDISVSEDNITSIGVKGWGNGVIVVMVDSYLFSDEKMGPLDRTFTVPNDTQRWVYNIEYFIFEELLFKDEL